MLRRKVDQFLTEWKDSSNKKPLIVKGARQIGKTTSIREFGKNYGSFIEINFISNPEYKEIFSDGYQPKDIIRNISLYNQEFEFIPGNTLILFDEIQDYPDALTSLKFFYEEGKYDIICSGSLLGVNYKVVTSVPVGFKQEYQMFSLDFEEFLWANNFKSEQIEELFNDFKQMKPLSKVTYEVYKRLFEDYIYCGGMPQIVNEYVTSKVFTNVFKMQQEVFQDYENDIIKYVDGLDKAKVKNMYRHITAQLAKENHKFQITKLGHGARSKDYVGCSDWLLDAGIINVAYNLDLLEFPFAGNENVDNYRIYYADSSLLVATLDEEAKKELTIQKNFGIYAGALFENIVAEGLVKQGYKLYFYRNEDATCELDFVIRVKNEVIPIEVKAKNGKTKSLNSILNNNDLNIKYGIKIGDMNLGFENNKLTIPYFLTFLLKRFLDEVNLIPRA